MEKIEIGYHPIASTLGISNHKFIIYTRSDGNSFQIHGGGSNDNGFSPLDEIASSVSPSNFEGFGFLNVTIFKTTRKTNVAPGTLRETVFEGPDLSAVFFKMAGMAQGIAEQKSPYNFLANNSNTLVDDVVKWSGGAAPTLDSGSSAPGSRADAEFKPDFFKKLPPPIWGKNLYTRHSDIVSEFLDSSDVEKLPEDATGPRELKRARGDFQGIEPAAPVEPDGFTPGRGDLFRPSSGQAADPQLPLHEQGSLQDGAPADELVQSAKAAVEDDDDLYRMAEEVFSSLTIDDWAVIPDDNDPFDGRDPFADGVGWVPGLTPPPAAL